MAGCWDLQFSYSAIERLSLFSKRRRRRGNRRAQAASALRVPLGFVAGAFAALAISSW